MAFQKGHKKLGGIKKGQKHQKTLAASEAVAAVHEGKTMVQVLLDHARESRNDRLSVYLALLPYCHSKLIPKPETDEKPDLQAELEKHLGKNEELLKLE